MSRMTVERSKIHHISCPSLPSSWASIFPVAKIRLVDRYWASKPDWLIPMESRNLIGWTSKLLKPHWMKSPYPITYGPTMFKTSYSLVIDFTKTNVLLTPVQTHTQTHKLFFSYDPPLSRGNKIFLLFLPNFYKQNPKFWCFDGLDFRTCRKLLNAQRLDLRQVVQRYRYLSWRCSRHNM